MRGVNQLDKRVPGFEVFLFTVAGIHRQFTAYEYAGINHRMLMPGQFLTWGYYNLFDRHFRLGQ